MIFNSYIFWLFFAVVFVIYRALNHRHQNYFLLVASYLFYGYWDWRFVFLMLFSTTVDFFAAGYIGESTNKKSQHSIVLPVGRLPVGRHRLAVAVGFGVGNLLAVVGE